MEKRRRRPVSFYVEWEAEEDVAAVVAVLRRMGAQVWEIDEDTDLQYRPCPEAKRAHTVFRFRADRAQPVYALLSAVAEHPGVYSVSEMGTRMPGRR